MLLSELKPNHDYVKEGRYLILSLRKKKGIRKDKFIEIPITWFDYNFGEKVEWLIVREYQSSVNGKEKYTNYKLENIHAHVSVVNVKGETTK
ncbi:DUF5513 family protein [Bacillus cereus]|uniref:Uncharacterized protein n=2 Tax=Bacillus cereus group TaxID=86661 RepID=A0A9W5QCI8_BACCE|nr:MULTISPECIES: DUF5513 family protein [Bacillus]AIE37069.1 hypothetical protein BTK_33721 [Bacillus thuringiensis serovar kurstaki str. HD-1]AJK38466.1 hypothetical protein BG08_6829 [Bacillus thuringiensis serovar kurstaki]AKJ62936.1 hypothetical protein XI92_32850 [Bacillus thuringiensis]ALL62463.1 hypothetical protein AQ980_32035 [Bacillus thuringiensis]AMX80658.1 hypothetical protein BtBc_30140 [Bacillus thuringiensis]